MSKPVSVPIESLHGHGHGHSQGSGGGGHHQITIAPNLQPRKHGKPTGITIRTSRHWVLPPRPKPGRRPSPAVSIKQQASASASASVSASASSVSPGVSSSVSPAPAVKVKTETEEHSVQAKKSDKGGSVTGSRPNANSIPLTNSKSKVQNAKQTRKSEITAKTQVKVKTEHSNAVHSPVSTATAAATAAAAAQPIPSQTPAPVQSADTKKKPSSKTALKKEIQILKMENNKLKQELSDLVGNLQELKCQFPIASPPEDANLLKTQKGVPAAKGKASAVAAAGMTRKRSIIDSDIDMLQAHPLQASSSSVSHHHHHEVKPEPLDDTEIFLKFDEDDEPHKDLIKNLSSSRMNQTSSLSSRTSFTDDDDLLLSSSTPSSLFSTDLNRTVSNQMFSTSTMVTNTGSSPSSSHTSNKSLQNSQYSDTIETMKFIDGYEQMEFYSKYKLSSNHSQEPLKSVQKLKSDHVASHQDELDCIREEEPVTDLLATGAISASNSTSVTAKPSNPDQDSGMLYFLQKHALSKNPGSKLGDLPIDLDDSLPSSLLLKLGEEDENSFMNLNLKSIDPDDPLNEHVTDTPFVAPTLEELMEEQDDKDSKLLGPENTEQDMDLLKMGIFFTD